MPLLSLRVWCGYSSGHREQCTATVHVVTHIHDVSFVWFNFLFFSFFFYRGIPAFSEFINSFSFPAQTNPNSDTMLPFVLLHLFINEKTWIYFLSIWNLFLITNWHKCVNIQSFYFYNRVDYRSGTVSAFSSFPSSSVLIKIWRRRGFWHLRCTAFAFKKYFLASRGQFWVNVNL